MHLWHDYSFNMHCWFLSREWRSSGAFLFNEMTGFPETFQLGNSHADQNFFAVIVIPLSYVEASLKKAVV